MTLHWSCNKLVTAVKILTTHQLAIHPLMHIFYAQICAQTLFNILIIPFNWLAEFLLTQFIISKYSCFQQWFPVCQYSAVCLRLLNNFLLNYWINKFLFDAPMHCCIWKGYLYALKKTVSVLTVNIQAENIGNMAKGY